MFIKTFFYTLTLLLALCQIPGLAQQEIQKEARKETQQELRNKAQKESRQIEGTVIDAESLQPLVNANIIIKDSDRGTTTDLQGNFKLSLAAEDLLQVSHVGFACQTFRLEQLEAAGFVLKLKSENILQDVIISAGRISDRDKLPLTVQKITKEDWESSDKVSLIQELASLPGVEQISMGNGIGKPVIRGLSFSRVLTLYQGARFENQQWGADHGLGVNDLGISAVEVIKGPASLLYGSGALGGVVYLIDEAPAAPGNTVGEFSSAFHSNTLGLRNKLGISSTNEKGYFVQAYGSYENHADYLDGDGLQINNTRFNTSTLRLLGGKEYEGGSLKLGYTFHKQLLGFIEDEEMAGEITHRSDRSMLDLYQDIDDHMLTAEWKQSLGRGSLQARLNHHRHIRQEIEDFEDIELGLNQGNTTLDLKYFLPVSNGYTHSFGTQSFVKTNRNIEGAEGVLFPDALVWDKSFFYMLERETEKISSQIGLRADRRYTRGDASSRVIAEAENDYELPLPAGESAQTISIIHSGLTGSMGLNFNLFPALIMKANLSSGFRAPDLAELFSNGRHPGTARFERGNTAFAREQSYQADLGWLWRPSGQFQLEFSPFYSLIDNFIFFSNTGQTMAEQLSVWEFNQRDAALYGAELSYTWQIPGLEGLSLAQSFSAVRGRERGAEEHLPFMPADRLRTHLQYTRPLSAEGLRTFRTYLSSLVVAAQQRNAPEELATPGYHLLHAGIGADLSIASKTLHIDIAAHNLLNTAYLDHLSFYRQQFKLQNMGRNIRLNLRVPFRF